MTAPSVGGETVGDRNLESAGDIPSLGLSEERIAEIETLALIASEPYSTALSELLSEVRRNREQIERARRVHNRSAGGAYCLHCYDEDGNRQMWPCEPRVRRG